MPTAFPWTVKLKTELSTALASAVTAGIFASGTGAVYNYDAWPASLAALPSILIGFGPGGTQTYGLSSPAILHHYCRIWIYMPTFTLAQAQAAAMPFMKIVRDQLAGSILLDNTVAHIAPPQEPALYYEGPGEVDYAGQKYIALILSYDVKEDETGLFTVSA